MKLKNIKFKAKQLNSGKWFEGDLVRLGWILTQIQTSILLQPFTTI